NRRAHLSFRAAAAIEGRLPQDDSDRRTQHCPADHSESKSRRRNSTRLEPAEREMKWNSRTRCALICLGFILLFSLFSFRLIYLQMIKHDEYVGRAAEKHVIKQPIFAERGTILDANDEVLAHNVPVETVVADASRLNNIDAIVDLVGRELKIPTSELGEK